MNTKWLYVTIIPKYTLDLELQTVDIKKIIYVCNAAIYIEKSKAIDL